VKVLALIVVGGAAGLQLYIRASYSPTREGFTLWPSALLHDTCNGLRRSQKSAKVAHLSWSPGLRLILRLGTLAVHKSRCGLLKVLVSGDMYAEDWSLRRLITFQASTNPLSWIFRSTKCIGVNNRAFDDVNMEDVVKHVNF
jgi:hypothetical protein